MNARTGGEPENTGRPGSTGEPGSTGLSEPVSPPRWRLIGRAEGRAEPDGARPDSARSSTTLSGSEVSVLDLDDEGRVLEERILAEVALPDLVRSLERGGSGAADAAAHGGTPAEVLGEADDVAVSRALGPRWVWSDTPRWYPALLAAGVRIDRCHDLRLAHAILRRSELVTAPEAIRAAGRWNAPPVTESDAPEALFEYDRPGGRIRQVPHTAEESRAEFVRQMAAVATASDPGRLRLLLAAESAGGLIAAEMHAAGVPWDVTEHDRILTEALGPRPRLGGRPPKMVEKAEEVREALENPRANLDSPGKLLQALQGAGINVASTSKWELREIEHPAIAPLLEYKKLARLLSANGWHWLDEWVHEGRYRPVYVPGGVVTGRWAASGGGALQIPRQLRPALRADPGWTLVSADVSQLEPRTLAAMSGDAAMARAGHGTDLYSGIVDSGIVETRQEAKIAVLGAMYGGTTGDSGRLVPRLRVSFPRAMGLVDHAAEVGAAGGVVSTWLGRTSPQPSEGWRRLQSRANQFDATPADESLARRAAGDQGRFTRNFVVQGTAAEWALAWMADLRLQLARLPEVEPSRRAQASGPVFGGRAHLVFFLHDEVIVHAPLDQADAAAEAIRTAADAAGRLLFGDAPVDFRLDLSIGERAIKG